MKALIADTLWNRWLHGRVRAETQPHRNQLKAQGKALAALRKDVRRLEESLSRTTGHLQKTRQGLLQKQDRVSRKLSSILEAQGRVLQSLTELQASHRTSARHRESLERTAEQLQLARRIDHEQREELARLPAHLDAAKLEQHVRSAIERAMLEKEPFPHVVIEDLFPSEFYSLLIEALPPRGFWDSGQVGRENWTMDMNVGPLLTESVWRFTNDTLAVEVLTPALVEKLRAVLEESCSAVFGPSAATEILDSGGRRSGGRLMLRRPGYCIQPHLDPSRSLLTFLLYLGRAGDEEEHGTKQYRVAGDLPAIHSGIFYADESDFRYECVKQIPYRPNTALVFLSQRGLHGADVPSDASPTLERYTYQFYVGFDKALRDVGAVAPT